MKRVLSVAACLVFPAMAFGHGTLLDGRMFQMRVAGPNGHLPAAWNDSYYTWNQDSNNFTDYAAPGFTYASVMPNGTIASAGINDGIHNFLDFSGLNIASPGWGATPATAGGTLGLRFLATAPHDPSFFDVFITKPGVDASTTGLTWEGLEELGKWSIGDPDRPVDFPLDATDPNPAGGLIRSYDFTIPIPSDLSGRAAVVVIWQRVDPAGEAFVSVQDMQVSPVAVPEPIGTGVVAMPLAAGLLRRRR